MIDIQLFFVFEAGDSDLGPGGALGVRRVR
jgi:hypothetical protein